MAHRSNLAPTFVPLAPHLGSSVEGIDIGEPMSSDIFECLRAELANRCLLVLPGQDITPAQQVAFSRRFGPLDSHVLSECSLDGHPEIFMVSNIVENGFHIGASGGSNDYHSDLAYMAEPSLCSLFYCLECPNDGGETAFASMFAAYDALPDERKRWLESHDAVYDYAWHHAAHMSDRPTLSEAQKASTPPVVHPSVRTHPETGRKALFVSELMTRTFEGEDEVESRALLAELTAFATQPEFVYVHKWTPHDMVIWDNRSTLHKGCPFDEINDRRRMHRTTVRGDRPFLHQ